MLSPVALLVYRRTLRLAGDLCTILLHVLTVEGGKFALLECIGELNSISRRTRLKARAQDAAFGIGDYRKRLPQIDLATKEILTRDKEVGRGLPVRRLVTHVDEILPGTVRRAEVRHPTLIDHTNLVEKLIERLSGLVNGDDRRKTANVSSETEGLHEFQGG